MKIIEYLFIDDNTGLFSVLSHNLPLEQIPDSSPATYRLEIDTDLVLLIYLLNTESEIPGSFMEQVFPGLARMVWLTSEENLGNQEIPDIIREKVEDEETTVPVIILIAVEKDMVPELAGRFSEKGYFLDENSRLIIWNRRGDDHKNIWKSVFGRIE